MPYSNHEGVCTFPRRCQRHPGHATAPHPRARRVIVHPVVGIGGRSDRLIRPPTPCSPLDHLGGGPFPDRLIACKQAHVLLPRPGGQVSVHEIEVFPAVVQPVDGLAHPCCRRPGTPAPPASRSAQALQRPDDLGEDGRLEASPHFDGGDTDSDQQQRISIAGRRLVQAQGNPLRPAS